MMLSLQRQLLCARLMTKNNRTYMRRHACISDKTATQGNYNIPPNKLKKLIKLIVYCVNTTKKDRLFDVAILSERCNLITNLSMRATETKFALI